MENKKNLLVTLADKNFVQQAKQLFSSVYWNAGWEGDYMLLAHEIPETGLKWFKDKGILVKNCKPLYDQTIGEYDYPATILDKFYLFTQEFKKWDHIVYLDADIIVRASLYKLIQTKNFSTPKTVKKGFRYYFSTGTGKEILLLEKEFNLERPAFNSGVFSFSTDIIQENTFEKLLNIFYKYKNIANGDDSIFNLFFYNYWTNIPLVYNARANKIGSKKVKAIILHFERDRFHPLLWEPEHRYYMEWKNNLDKAEFMDLSKIRNVKKWNNFKIEYYNLILNLKIYRDSMVFKLKLYLNRIIRLPGRLIGKIGTLIKMFSPDLYYRLKRIKSAK